VGRSDRLNLLLQLRKQRIGRAELGPKVLALRSGAAAAHGILLLLAILLLSIGVPGVLAVRLGSAVPAAAATTVVAALLGAADVLLRVRVRRASSRCDTVGGGRVGGLRGGLVTIELGQRGGNTR
jgi:hypothetical protein